MRKSDIQNSEIDLLGLLPVIAKRRKLILILFFVTTIFSFIKVFLTPELNKPYVVSTIIKTGFIGTDNHVFDPDEIKEDIEKGVFNSKVDLSSLPMRLRNPRFFVDFFDSGKYFKVSLNVKKIDIENGKNLLRALFAALKNDFQDIVSKKKSQLDAVLNLARLNLERYSLEIKSSENNVRRIKTNIEKKENLISEISGINLTTIQEEFTALRDRLNIAEHYLQAAINKQKTTLTEINTLTLEKDAIVNFVLLENIEAKPNEKEVNIFIVCLIYGLFISIFLAYSLDFWQLILWIFGKTKTI